MIHDTHNYCTLKTVELLEVTHSLLLLVCVSWAITGQPRNSVFIRSVVKISRHSVLSGDRIRQCETSSGSLHKDTDQCLQVAISFCRHRSVPVPCENGSAETTVAEGGQNPVAGLWGYILGENWPPAPTSSYASIDFWCQLVASPTTAVSWMSVVAMVG